MNLEHLGSCWRTLVPPPPQKLKKVLLSAEALNMLSTLMLYRQYWVKIMGQGPESQHI